MNALSRFGTTGKTERKKGVVEGVKYMKYALAIVLHTRFGFTKRLDYVFEDIAKILGDYSKRYDSDYLLTALEHDCREIGIKFKE